MLSQSDESTSGAVYSMRLSDQYSLDDLVKRKMGREDRLESVEEPRSVRRWYKPEKPVLEGSRYSMGDGLLGLCVFYGSLVRDEDGEYRTPIVRHKGLGGENAGKVLAHEREHERDPVASEREVRERTGTVDPDVHPYVSCLN